LHVLEPLDSSPPARVIPDSSMTFVVGWAVRATGRMDTVIQQVGCSLTYREVESKKCHSKEDKGKAELRHDSVLAGAETRFRLSGKHARGKSLHCDR
jgi:hypothetical protein